jgi:hypothetical protein
MMATASKPEANAYTITGNAAAIKRNVEYVIDQMMTDALQYDKDYVASVTITADEDAQEFTATVVIMN